MQFKLPFESSAGRKARDNWLRVGGRHLPLDLVPNLRARRYILRLNRNGGARVTIPRGGSAVDARRFAEKHSSWLERQLLRQASRVIRPGNWGVGTSILFRGDSVRLETCSNEDTTRIHFGSETLLVQDLAADLRLEVERHLMRLASEELPARTVELAALHAIPIRRISIRNQRSRWGSCSRRGTISLNWRLIQTPPFVRDYILLHELAHVKVMNHSAQFWRVVERLCPEYQQAERWLKQHSELLR